MNYIRYKGGEANSQFVIGCLNVPGVTMPKFFCMLFNLAYFWEDFFGIFFGTFSCMHSEPILKVKFNNLDITIHFHP